MVKVIIKKIPIEKIIEFTRRKDREKRFFNLTKKIFGDEPVHSDCAAGEFRICIGEPPLISIYLGSRKVETFSLKDSDPHMNLVVDLLKIYESLPREEEWTLEKYQ